MKPGSPIIVFDGVCHLCNGCVGFVLKRDKMEQFMFSATQTATGRRLLRNTGSIRMCPLEHCRAYEEEIMKTLEIPYRVVRVCTGDMGAPATRNTTSRHGSQASGPIVKRTRIPTCLTIKRED